MDDVMTALTAWGTVAAAFVALIVGVIGLVFAKQAKAAAIGANSIASEANRLAEAANRTMEMQAARSIERSDVDWQLSFDPDYAQHVLVQNIGKSFAKRVMAQVFFDGQVESNHPKLIDMEGREQMRLEIPGLAAARHETSDLARYNEQSFDPVTLPKHQLRLRVSWETPLGTARSYESGNLFIVVDPFPRP
jgi:hypothetical protein